MKLSSMYVYCAVIVVSLLVRRTFCANYTDAKNLRTKLFVTDGYDKKLRPIHNQSETIEVYVALNLMSIDDLSETTKTLKTTGFLMIFWTDELLQWDPSAYNDLEYYDWPQGDVWKPDVALKNSFLEYKELGVPSLNVFVTNDGQMSWYPFQVFQSTCTVNLEYFPFDEQVCELKFVAWSYTADQVKMVSSDKGIVMDQYEPNPEWEVIDTSFYDSEFGESSVIFRIKVKRKPLHVILSVILPIIMLAFLNIFVFVLPSDGGEKASYAMTTFLAFAVFLSIVSTTFPENSEVVPIISVYLIVQIIQSTMISVVALLLIRVVTYDDDNTPVPNCLLRVTGNIPSRNLENRKQSSDAGNLGKNDRSKAIEDPKDESEKKKLHWKDVVKMLDKIFFVFFLLILLISSTTCFLLASGNI